MKLTQLHNLTVSDVTLEDWRRDLRGLALGTILGTGLGYGISKYTTPSHIEPKQRPKNIIQKPFIKKERTASSEIENFVSEYEGFRNKAYIDSEGIPTIGIGFNLRRPDAKRIIQSLGYDYNKVIYGRKSLKDEDIRKIFKDDLKSAINNARKSVSNFDELPSPAQKVVVDMVFNLGPNRFRGFKKTIAALEDYDFRAAANEMKNSRWFKQVGNRSKRNVGIISSLSR